MRISSIYNTILAVSVQRRVKEKLALLQVTFIAVVSALAVWPMSLAAQQRRLAAIYFSDGRVVTGKVSLTSGRKFKLNIPKAGTIKTSDMVTGEPVKYGKVRYFDFGTIKEMVFYPEKEEMRRKWRFTETTKYDIKTAKADYTPAAKAYSGEQYPVRYLNTRVVFNSGENLQGHLYTAVIFLQTKDNKVKKYILRSKQRGKEGDTLDKLIYIRMIKPLDRGEDISPVLTVKFASVQLDPNDTPQAITRKTLTPIPTQLIDKNTCKVESAFGDDVYLAVKKKNVYLVGWPGHNNPNIVKLAADFVKRQRDFYNDKKLLGAIVTKNGKEVLTLLNLRRRVAPTNFGKIGGEWDKERNGLVEPWRLSIWRWKYDKANKELTLVARGTFFRVIFLPKEPTPKVIITPELWMMHRNKNTVTVGQKPATDKQKTDKVTK